MKNAIDSAGAFLKERTTGAFIGVYLTSFAVLNRNSLLILIFSEESITDRILLAKEWQVEWYWMVAGPFMIALSLLVGGALVEYWLERAIGTALHGNRENLILTRKLQNATLRREIQEELAEAANVETGRAQTLAHNQESIERLRAFDEKDEVEGGSETNVQEEQEDSEVRYIKMGRYIIGGKHDSKLTASAFEQRLYEAARESVIKYANVRGFAAKDGSVPYFLKCEWEYLKTKEAMQARFIAYVYYIYNRDKEFKGIHHYLFDAIQARGITVIDNAFESEEVKATNEKPD